MLTIKSCTLHYRCLDDVVESGDLMSDVKDLVSVTLDLLTLAVRDNSKYLPIRNPLLSCLGGDHQLKPIHVSNSHVQTIRMIQAFCVLCVVSATVFSILGFFNSIICQYSYVESIKDYKVKRSWSTFMAPLTAEFYICCFVLLHTNFCACLVLVQDVVTGC